MNQPWPEWLRSFSGLEFTRYLHLNAVIFQILSHIPLWIMARRQNPSSETLSYLPSCQTPPEFRDYKTQVNKNVLAAQTLDALYLK